MNMHNYDISTNISVAPYPVFGVCTLAVQLECMCIHNMSLSRSSKQQAKACAAFIISDVPSFLQSEPAKRQI
jgi:hypothetical protein